MDESDNEDDFEILFMPIVKFVGSTLNPRRRHEYDAAASEDEMVTNLMLFLKQMSAQGQSMDDTNMTSPGVSGSRSCLRLLDMAAHVVGQHCSCEQLEAQKPPLDEALLRMVALWSFPQDEKQVQAFANLTDRYSCWERGIGFIRDNRIREMWQVGFMATAYLTKYPSSTSSEAGSSDIRVSLTFEQQQIVSSTCSECKCEIWCPHVIAAVVYRIRHPEKVRVHAPMTETLSTLDRDQLQKLLQYAISEDPAGILGKVFKHLDAVRDTTSEMSSTQGAPDPTFGRQNGAKTQWELSLDWLRKNLNADLFEMTKHRAYDYADSLYYPEAVDLLEKANSKMYMYFRKVLQLACQGQTIAAADVLVAITKCVLQKMKLIPRYDGASLARFCHDLVHLFTLLLLQPQLEATARLALLEAAHKFNRTSRFCNLMDSVVDNSEWAEMPSILHLYESKLARTARLEGTMFLEPLAAQFVPKWPAELYDLMSGKTNFENSLYDEELVLMLARMDTLLLLGTTSMPRLAQLALKITCKIVLMMQGDSVLGEYAKQHNAPPPPVVKLLHMFRWTGASHTLRGSTKVGKGRSGKRGSKGKGPAAKKLKKSPEQEIKCNLAKSQLAYSLLYCMWVVTQKAKTVRDLDQPELVVSLALFALEMCRLRTVAPRNSIRAMEHSWLLKLETQLCTFLLTSCDDATTSRPFSVYLNALCAVKCRFYDGAYPLVLLDLLLQHTATRDGDAHRDAVIRICADLLLDSRNILDKFTLPTSSLFDILMDTLMEPAMERKRHRDFALRKLHTVVSTFMQLADIDNREHLRLLIAVLNHFESIDVENVALLRMIQQVVREQATKLSLRKVLVAATLRLVLHVFKSYKQAETFNIQRYTAENRLSDREFVFRLARQMGTSSLKLFQGQWEEIFSNDDMQELIMMFAPKIREYKSIPCNVVAIILQVYSCKKPHNEAACELLSLFTPGDMNYQQAVAAIRTNLHHFHPNAIFELAKRQQELSIASSGDKSNALMDESTFAIVEHALENIQVTSDSTNAKTLEHIGWMYRCCGGGGSKPKDVAKSALFTRMIRILCENACYSPDVLLVMLECLDKVPGMTRHIVALGTTLLSAYLHYFDRRFSECSHATYANVIGEMQRARLQCRQYVKDGDTQFGDIVVTAVRTSHAGKKKLQKMLGKEFPAS